jgi:hypothetical protein
LIRSADFLSSEHDTGEAQVEDGASRVEKVRRVDHQVREWQAQHETIYARFVALGIDVGAIPLPRGFCASDAQRIRFCCAMLTLHHRSGKFGHRNLMNLDGSLDFFVDISEQTAHNRVFFPGPRAALQF